MSVKNVMTKEVVSVKATEDVKDAWLVLMEMGLSGAPVVDDSGSLTGILSITDIFRAILERVYRARALRESTAQMTDPEAIEKEEIRELSLAIRAVTESKISTILPKDQKVLSLSPDDSLDRAIHMIAEHDINRLPVVHENLVVGIITRQDIIWVIAGRPGKGAGRTESAQVSDKE
jgi:CBS domain-containing protein